MNYTHQQPVGVAGVDIAMESPGVPPDFQNSSGTGSWLYCCVQTKRNDINDSIHAG